LQVGNVVHFPALHLQRAWTLAPVTLLYVSNVAFALMGLQNLNIPMYNTLKRLTPVIVLFTRVSRPCQHDAVLLIGVRLILQAVASIPKQWQDSSCASCHQPFETRAFSL
jgi:hypothetical protein